MRSLRVVANRGVFEFPLRLAGLRLNPMLTWSLPDQLKSSPLSHIRLYADIASSDPGYLIEHHIVTPFVLDLRSLDT